MKDRLVAHRGDMTQYIENTLPAIAAAVDLGIQWIEIDIQLSKDLLPMVVHDDELVRLASRHDYVSNMYSTELQDVAVTVSADKQSTGSIPSLLQVVELLNQTPQVTLFVEIKKESISIFGIQDVMQAVAKVLHKAKFKIVLISFLYDVVMQAKNHYQLQTGWVFTHAGQVNGQHMQALQPEFVFCDTNKIAQISDFEDYAWQWVLYDVTDPEEAYQLMQADNVMIETGDIHALMRASILNRT
jgi:glycerophosphoryl diester phosphodiesterase